VLKIENISDPSQLKQIAILLQKENDRMHARLAEMTKELAKLKGQDGNRQLELEIENLQSQMSKLQRQLFAPSSERRPSQKKEEKEKEPQTGHGPREQLHLKAIEHTYELDEKEKNCELCGGSLEEWEGQEEATEEITVVKRSFYIKKNKQKKYRCKCGGCIKTAPKPPALVKGGRYTAEFALEVAEEKYFNHMPLERQVKKMIREGLIIDSQTLWDQLWHLSRLLLPTYEAMRQYVFSFPIIGADESRWYYIKKGKRKTWYIWGAACPFGVYYELDPSRSKETAKRFLSGYEGKIITDGYKAYDVLGRDGPNKEGAKIILINCWAHARRQFVECEKDYPIECGEFFDMLAKVYKKDKEVPNPWLLPAREREAAFEKRAKIRDKEIRPMIKEIKAWAMSKLALPQSSLSKALKYMLGRFDKLSLFLDDPRIPLDTNEIERTFRGPVVGRKNHYGSKSIRGTQVAAIFYTLIESAKLCKINPGEYLEHITKELLKDPTKIILPYELM
jgi:transposase